uniref:Leucine-binding protein domain-containing protein n=1 Tax=Magnetococcus massalia (strain MO-1) TaxID=451514 RepID=A0A1S7LKM2_MAGMO|nr:conserved protein of unknown function [Candidatus Magnetococcus massalia]
MAEERPYHIYIDADWIGALPSSQAIEWGIKAALSEHDFKLAGHTVEIKRLNHRGNTRRHLANQKRYLQDDRALVVFTGLHSPPLLANRAFIHKQQILTLNPWAAAGPITRDKAPNWIFRLSVDDAVAGHVIVEHAIKKRGFKNLVLIAEDTGWGRFNHKNMRTKAMELGLNSLPVLWSNWGMAKPTAKILLRRAANMGADAILLVTNPAESVTIAQAMAELERENRRPLQSHWGVSAGHFAQRVGLDVLKQIDLQFIQSDFSFLHSNLSELAKRALAKAKNLFPDQIKQARDINPPAGFVHAYDLTRILIAAAKQAGLRGEVIEDRGRLHDALEQLKEPVEGLIKTYQTPFHTPEKAFTDAHEALGVPDYAMAYFDELGDIRLSKSGP